MEKRTVGYALPVVILVFLGMIGLSLSMYSNQVSQLEAVYKNFEMKKTEIDRLSGELARNKEDIGGYMLKIEEYEHKIKEYEKQVNTLQNQIQSNQKSIQEVKSQVNLASRSSKARTVTQQQLVARSSQEGSWMDFKATWYTPAGGVGDGLVTASGLKVSESVIAVDPTVIPLGSIVEVQYDDGRIERKVAADKGGAVKGKKIDIFCWSQKEALNNGRKNVKVRIIGKM